MKTKYEGHDSFRRKDEASYTYDRKFEGNILILKELGVVKQLSFKIWVKITFWGHKRGLLDIENLTFERKG